MACGSDALGETASFIACAVAGGLQLFNDLSAADGAAKGSIDPAVRFHPPMGRCVAAGLADAGEDDRCPKGCGPNARQLSEHRFF